MTPEDSAPWPFVRSVDHQAETESTNDRAKQLARDDALGPLPALVWADRQTRGRGQGSNAWWSDAGSLTASVVIDPEDSGLALGVRPRVALGVAAAVVAAIEELVPGCWPGIRWPNDIEVHGRKLGGILVEGVVAPSGPRLVVGVGLNVGTRLDSAPREVRTLAASLAEYGLGAGDRPAVLRAILARFARVLADLAGDAPALAATWDRLDALHGATVTVQAGTERFVAHAEGIEPGGGLRIRRAGRDEIEILRAGRILRD